MGFALANPGFGSRYAFSCPYSISTYSLCHLSCPSTSLGYLSTQTHTVPPAHLSALLNTPPRGSSSDLDAPHGAVLAYTDAMTLDVRVPNAVFAALESEFSDKEVVEITATVASYNCVSRFLVALDVGEKNVQTGPTGDKGA